MYTCFDLPDGYTLWSQDTVLPRFYGFTMVLQPDYVWGPFIRLRIHELPTDEFARPQKLT
jgi:hypothetical protein